MTGDHKGILESEHLTELAEEAPTSQPVVVIQYRSRGASWYLVLLLLAMISLGSIAIYHRVTTRARLGQGNPPIPIQSSKAVASTVAPTTRVSDNGKPSQHSSEATDLGTGLPLA